MRSRWSWVLGAVVLVGVVWWGGTAPFVRGVRSLDAATLAVGVALGVAITVASAWRWRLIARALGVEVSLGRATAAYYRSQLLNSVLPGGVLGDLLRGVDHGRRAGDAPRGLRSVAWERAAGQLVQAALALLVLALLPSPVRSTLPAVLTVLLICVAVLVGLARTWDTLRADLGGLVRERVWPGVVAASVVTVAGYVATYLVAARAVGVTAPLTTVVPLTMLVLVAAAVPANLAGWGPREGMAAWAFGAAGVGAAEGVAASVAFGVLVLAATLPGALVLLTGTVAPRATRRSEAVVGRDHG